jgi:hypothetical protein
MSETTTPEVHVQPLMNRRKVKRFVIAIIAAVVILIAFFIIQNIRDFDLPAKANTVGWIAAIQKTPTGSQVVMIKPDGTIEPSKGYQDGVNDRDPVWRPDGNRLFFVSDRADNKTGKRQVNIFRWNPGSGKIERRSATQGAYVNMDYSSVDPDEKALVALAGKIVEFDPATGDTVPILPPRVREAGSAEGGRVSSIEGSLFAPYGSSFKSAAWFGKKKFMVAIMKGDTSETILLQDMTPVDGQLRRPMPLGSGERIDMDVSPTRGVIVFTLQGFKFPDPTRIPPESIQNGKVVTPFRHAIVLLEPAQIITADDKGTKIVQPTYMLQLPTDANAFASPVFSPDGNAIAVEVGTFKRNEFQMTGLLGMPAVANGGANPLGIHRGPVTSVSFSGNGEQIAYAQREADGTSSIHVMDLDGKNDRKLLEGDYSQPAYSPQK